MKKIYLCAALILMGSLASVAQLTAVSMNATGKILKAENAISVAGKNHPQSNHSTSAADDVGMIDTFPSPYTMIPFAQLQPLDISARVVNAGTNTETNAGYNINVYLFQNGLLTGMVYNSTSATAPSLNPGDTSANLSGGTFTPTDTGVYLFQYLTFMDSADMDATNDTLLGYIVVNDSSYARDYAVVNNLLNFALGFNAGTGTLGQKFDVYTTTAVTSVTFYLSHGVIGDQTRATILAVNGSGIPTTLLGTSTTYTMTAADTAGTFLTLPFAAPVVVNPGSFFAGVTQLTSGHNVSLGLCNDIFIPGTAFYRTTGAWVPIDSTPYHGSFIVRPNTSITALGVNEYSSTEGIDIYPNPSTGIFHIKGESKPDEDFFVTVFNVLGEVVYRNKFNNLSSEPVIDLSKLSPAVYSVLVTSKTTSFSKPIVIDNH